MTDRKQYLNEYQRNYIQVKVVFDKRRPEQMELLNWIRTHTNVSDYLKALAQADKEKAVR